MLKRAGAKVRANMVGYIALFAALSENAVRATTSGGEGNGRHQGAWPRRLQLLAAGLALTGALTTATGRASTPPTVAAPAPPAPTSAQPLGPPPPPPQVLHVDWGQEIVYPLLPGVRSQLLPDTGDFLERRGEPAPSARSRARYGERGNRIPPAPLPVSRRRPRPPINRPFFPGVFDGVLDPTLAVGTKYVAVSEAHHLAFFDKQQKNSGQAIPLQAAPGGLKTSLSYNEFFSGLVAPTNPDGSVNQQSINRYLQLGPSPVLGCDLTQIPTYPARPFAPTDACVNEFYDARVFFDAVHKRFVVVAQARNTIGIWTKEKLESEFDSTQTWREYLKGQGYTDAEIDNLPRLNSVARRYLAFAVSRTEDPRDGFHQYILTESNYADWPLGAVSQRLLVLGHMSAPEAGKPALYGISVDAIESGAPNPPLATLPQSAFGGSGYPVPVVGYGYGVAPLDAVWLVNDAASPLRIYGLPDFNDPAVAFQNIFHTQVSPPRGQIGGHLRSPPVYRNGSIYIASPLLAEPRPTDYAGSDDLPRYSVRVTRIPVSFKNGLKASTDASAGFRDGVFGLNALQDAPSDRVSYEVAALAVNKHDDVVISYGRRGVHTTTPLPPEARYTLWYKGEADPRPSRLLKAGDTFIPLKRLFFAVDLMAAVVDPTDDTTVWMIGAYAKSSGLALVVGKVKP